MNRRSAVALLGGLTLAGCSVNPTPPPPSRCVSVDSLSTYGQIGGARLVYEEDQIARSFRIDSAFAEQVTGWLASWDQAVGATTTAIRTYGTWIDGGGACTSMHHSGRALDIAAMTSGGVTTVTCRTDRWAGTAAELLAYWRLAASLHRRFAYVLTYLYDADHANHIHVDDSISRSQGSVFTGRSRVQIHAVQAICTYVLGRETPLSGSWDAATRRAVSEVTASRGLAADLTRTPAWHAFLDAAAQG